MVNGQWTHIAKAYAMMYSPWDTELALNRALDYTKDQDFEGDSAVEDIVHLLDLFKLGDDVRKDKVFRANVSHYSIQLSIPSTLLIWIYPVSAWTSGIPGQGCL